jgi:hypothetical protein
MLSTLSSDPSGSPWRPNKADTKTMECHNNHLRFEECGYRACNKGKRYRERNEPGHETPVTGIDLIRVDKSEINL